MGKRIGQKKWAKKWAKILGKKIGEWGKLSKRDVGHTIKKYFMNSGIS